jgi:hypothetical protein
MATILEFRVTEHGGARNGTPNEGAVGEIIIFPGVRIERHDTPRQALQTASSEPSAKARTTSQA